jgi:hypothetical protein
MKRLNEVLLFIVEHHLLSMDSSSDVEASKTFEPRFSLLRKSVTIPSGTICETWMGRSGVEGASIPQNCTDHYM